jgi:hypothetical protein
MCVLTLDSSMTSDLAVGEAACDQLEHVTFARRQLAEPLV